MNLNSAKIKKSIYIAYTILIFLAAPLKYYFPTSIVLEISLLIGLGFLVIYRFRYQQETFNYLILSVFYIVSLFVYGTIIGTQPISFFKENYRFFFFYLIFIVAYLLPLDYRYILRIALWCCIFNVFFTIYELLSLNVFNFGDYNQIFFIGKEISNFEEDSPYLQQQSELIIPFIRPFGLLLQPQKSAFIPVFGILITYALSKEISHKVLLYSLFVLNLIITGGKTAILTGFLVSYIILFDVNMKTKIQLWKVYFYFGVFFLLLVFIIFSDTDIQHIVLSDVSNDIMGLFNYPISNVLFGVGIPDEADLKSHGFICESFLARIVAQCGIINTTILVLLSIYLFRVKDRKINLIILSLFFGLLIHYCCINSYFIAFILSIYICFYKKGRIVSHGYSNT